MSQQINLLNPALIKQKDLLNPNIIAITLGLLATLMLVYFGISQKQLSALTAQRSETSNELTMLQSQLKQTAQLHTAREPNKALLDQIVQLEQKEEMQQQVLKTVNLSSATPEKGYAALIRAFAKQSLDGLWLTGFNIDSNTDQLNISGRTLQSDLVPEYISRLSNEPALKGKLFSALTMNQAKVDASASKKAPVATTTPAPAPTNALIKNNNVAPLANTNAPAETPYLEFALQSTHEKSATDVAADKAKDGGR